MKYTIDGHGDVHELSRRDALAFQVLRFLISATIILLAYFALMAIAHAAPATPAPKPVAPENREEQLEKQVAGLTAVVQQLQQSLADARGDADNLRMSYAYQQGAAAAVAKKTTPTNPPENGNVR